MPETISCPECRRLVRVPDAALGRRVRCPGCSASFVASATPVAEATQEVPPVPAPVSTPPPLWPAPAAEAAEEILARAQEPRPPAADATDWHGVRAGLGLNLWAHVLYLGAVFVFLVWFLTLLGTIETRVSAPPRDPFAPRQSNFLPILMTVLLYVGGLLGLTNWLLAVVGGSFCLAAPARHNARGLAIATLVMSGLVLLGFMETARFFPLAMDRGRHDESGVVGVGLLFLFLFDVMRLTLLAWFLRGLCDNLRQRHGAAQALLLGILTPALLLGLLAFNIFLMFMLSPGPALTVVLAFLSLAAHALVLILGVMQMLQLRQAVGRKLAPFAAE